MAKSFVLAACELAEQLKKLNPGNGIHAAESTFGCFINTGLLSNPEELVLPAECTLDYSDAPYPAIHYDGFSIRCLNLFQAMAEGA